MNLRTDEVGRPERTDELALAKLDEVSGGDRNIDIRYFNWVKQFYAPWANIHFGRGPVMIA